MPGGQPLDGRIEGMIEPQLLSRIHIETFLDCLCEDIARQLLVNRYSIAVDDVP